VSITEEERLCRNHKGHMSKETPKRVSLSLYLHHFHTREKRAEQPHLLARFSPVLGFPSHMLCLFVNGVIVFYCSLFSAFYLFHA
jgi:hypothetical protein